MTNITTKNTSKAEASATAESRALSVITASGATELQAHAVFLAVEPLARRAYLHNNDREQWQNKPTSARPLRPFWAVLYAANGVKKDGTPKWADKKKPARAMRAAAAVVLSAFNDKFRDKSKEGLEIFLLSVETAIIGVIAPASKEKPADDGSKEKASIERAIKTLEQASNNHLLTAEQIKAIGDIASSGILTASKAAPEPALA